MSDFAAASAILGGSGGIFGAAQSGGASLSAIVAFRSYERDQVAARQNFADRADVKAAIDAFKKDVSRLDTVDDLLNDRDTLQFLLAGFGLDAEINNPGKIRAVIESDPDDINSLANRLADTRFGELAKFLDTPNNGISNLQSSTNQSKVIDKYLTVQFERDLGVQNPAARDALFFLRRINDVNSTFEILADPALRGIVTDALNLPPEIARQSVEKQASLVERGINLDDFKVNGSTEATRSRVEVLTDDLNTISNTSQTIDAAISALTDITTRLDTARSQYADLVNISDPAGVNAAEIAVQETAIPELLRQRGLTADANQATLNTRVILDQLDDLFLQARNAEDATALADIQTQFTDLADQVLGDDGFINSATFFDPATGLTQNILRNGTGGTLPTGTSATAAQIDTTVATDGTRAITNSTDLASFLTELQTARDSFAAANFATLSVDIDTAEANFDTAETTFEPAETLNGINVASILNALNNTQFSKELDTQSLSRGQLSIDDGLSRITTIERVLSDIKELAQQAQEAGANLTKINASYTARLSELNTLINTPGSVTDGTSTINFDNLLADGTVNYTVFDANQARAEGGDLKTSLIAALPASITVGNAATLETDVDDTYKVTVTDLKNQLERDRSVINYALETLDPRGRLDATLREIGTTLDEIIAGADNGGDNLLSEFASNLRVTLDAVGTTLTIDAQTSFKSDFQTALNAFDYTALNGGDDDARVVSLNDALFTAQGTLGRLRAESYALNIQREILFEEKTAIEGDGGQASDFLQPIEFTDAALKFIERYLVQKDLEAQGFSVDTNFNADVAIAQQIASILPQTGLVLNLLV